MFDSAAADAVSVERKSNEVVVVLFYNLNTEFMGKDTIRDIVAAGHWQVALKDLDGRLFEEQLGASYPCVGQRFVVMARRERAQR